MEAEAAVRTLARERQHSTTAYQCETVLLALLAPRPRQLPRNNCYSQQPSPSARLRTPA